jgi:selenocysteine lyase/cysteine desulfurase
MLIPKSEFVGLETVAHLCTGGESPLLKSHRRAIDQFFSDKVTGETSRARFEATYQRCRQKAARLLAVEPAEIALLASASEGINLVAHALSWQPGDNVVVCDVEFPSDVLPWTRLQSQGVEIRVVSQRDWVIHLDDLAAAIDGRTRVVAVSLVSYFTGQRLDLVALSALVRASSALLLVDATHAAGAVTVPASYADVLVSSCYKWLLGVHGVGLFYWNRQRLPDLPPPFLGWHSGLTIPDWQAPTTFILRPDADRFVAANPNYLGVYVLDNALDYLLQIGSAAIEAHALQLSGLVWAGLTEQGWAVMTPQPAVQRAGNICFTTPDTQGLTRSLAEQGVLVWGSYGGVGSRVRVSTHLYNDEADVERLLAALGAYAA